MILLGHELRANAKSFCIWTISILICVVGLIFMFESVADKMKQAADSFSQMGNFSKAFGMDQLNIATLNGYYAIEIARIISIGGAMYAALVGITALSKEEEGHTAEFLYTMPLKRSSIVKWKYLSIIVLLVLFNAVIIVSELATMLFVKDSLDMSAFATYHALNFLMEVEIASFCFMLSAFQKRKQVGLAMGLAIFAYLADIICRLVTTIDFLKYVTPFYFSNVSDIFTKAELDYIGIGIAVGVTLISYWLARLVMARRDIKG